MVIKYNQSPYYTMTVLLEYIGCLLKISINVAINVFYIFPIMLALRLMLSIHWPIMLKIMLA